MGLKQSLSEQGIYYPEHRNAEVAIVGSMLIDARCIGPVLSLVTEDDFSYPGLREIFRTVRRLFDAGKLVDPITVCENLPGGAQGDRAEILAEAMRVTPTAANAEEYCRYLREQNKLLRMKAMAERVLAANTADEARDQLSEYLKDATGMTGMRRTSIRDALNGLLDRLADDTPPQFIRWGMPVMDEHLQVKANKGKFIVIGARSSVGKTAFALQLAFSMMATGKRVGFYSLETDDETAYDRVFVQRARIRLRDLQNKRASDPEVKRLMDLGETLYKRPALDMDIIECAGMTATELRTDILVNRYDVVFVDYIQFMRGRGDSRAALVTNLSIELHTIARELGVHLIGLSQLTTPQDAKDKKYRLNRKEDLRESQQLINDADVIMIMSQTREDDPNFRELVIDKNKEGPLGVIELDFAPEYMSFSAHQSSRSESYQNVVKASKKAQKERKEAELRELADDEGGELPNDWLPV